MNRLSALLKWLCITLMPVAYVHASDAASDNFDSSMVDSLRAELKSAKRVSIYYPMDNVIGQPTYQNRYSVVDDGALKAELNQVFNRAIDYNRGDQEKFREDNTLTDLRGGFHVKIPRYLVILLEFDGRLPMTIEVDQERIVVNRSAKFTAKDIVAIYNGIKHIAIRSAKKP